MENKQFKLANKVNRLQTRANIKGQKIQRLGAKQDMMPMGTKPTIMDTFHPKAERDYIKKQQIGTKIANKQAGISRIESKIQKISPKVTSPEAKLVPPMMKKGRSTSDGYMAR